MGPKKEFKYSEEVSILSAGVKIEGTFKSDGNVRIDGSIYGDVFVNGNLTLGETSKVRGQVNAQNITICGTVEGSLKASEKIVLESKSRLYKTYLWCPYTGALCHSFVKRWWCQWLG